MTSENVTEAGTFEPAEPKPSKAVDDRLIEELVSRAQAEGLQLTGEGGLLQQLTKRLLGPPWRVRSPTTSAMTSTIQSGRTAAIAGTGPAPRPC